MVKTTLGRDVPKDKAAKPKGHTELLQGSLSLSREGYNEVNTAKASVALETLRNLDPGSRTTLDLPRDAKLGVKVNEEKGIIVSYSDHDSAVTYIIATTVSDPDNASRLRPGKIISIRDASDATVPSLDELLSAFGDTVGRPDIPRTQIPIEFTKEIAFVLPITRKH